MIKVIKEFHIGPSSRESFVNDLSRDDAIRFNLLMADTYGDDCYYDDLSKEEWKHLKDLFYGVVSESKKNENSVKVTESIDTSDFSEVEKELYDGVPEEAFMNLPDGSPALEVLDGNDYSSWSWIISGNSNGGCTIWYIGDDAIAHKDYGTLLPLRRLASIINSINNINDEGFIINESKKTEGKKITESFFRDSFEDWYDFLDEEERAEVDQYMEDEGMPDMVSDLSRTDMENILDHFDSDHLEYLYDQEDEGNRIKGGWQFDEGPYEEGYKKTESSTGETSYTVEYETVDGDKNWADITVEPTTGEYLFDSGYIEGYDSNSISMIYNDNVDPSPLVNKEIEIYDGDKYLATIRIISVEKALYNYIESKKTEASHMDNEFYGGGTVYIGLYGDDCGQYGSLEEFKSALKKAGIKILDVSGDEEYGWDMTINGIAKEIFKLVDGKIPGYNCDDVVDFIEQYALDPEEFRDHDVDLYSPEFLGDPDDDLEEACEPLKESFRDDFYDWYDFLSDEEREEVDAYMEEEGYPDMVTDLSDSDMEKIMDHFNPDYFDAEESDGWLREDTVRKSNGKWTNKGKDGEHGEFKTKKAADAQRKAMFANRYKGESNELSFIGNKHNRVSEEELDNYPEGTMIKFKSINGDRVITLVKDGGMWKNKDPRFNTNRSSKEMSQDLFGIRYFDIYYPRDMVGARDEMDEAYGDSLRDAPNPYDDEEYSDFSDGSVRRGEKFIEDGIEYEWVDEASDVYYLDFDAWQVWKAERTDDLEEAYFVVDKDTSFIDWGPCDTEMEAIEFLHSKVDDYNSDVDEDDLMDGLLD